MRSTGRRGIRPGIASRISPGEPARKRSGPSGFDRGRLGILVLAGTLAAAGQVAAQDILKPGFGSEPSPETIRVLVERANRGDAQAQYDLAVHFATRRSAGLASSEAVHWLRQAAEQGHVEAQSDLGLLYHRGAGVPQDAAEAARWLRRAAEQGHAASQADLGRLHYLGDGVPRDLARAAEWYHRAAEQGFAPAQFNLAGLYASGAGVSRDAAKAASLYRRAADRGLAEAQHAYALALIRAEGVERDYGAAAGWLRRAAPQGLSDAQVVLARLYETGLGVDRDPGRALRWYLFAADQGSAQGQRFLGRFYRDGRGGITDPVRGQMWLILAARNAPDRSRVQVARERDLSARTLTADQAAEAQRLASQWRPRTWAELRSRSPGELTPRARSRGSDLPGFFRAAGRNIDAARNEYDEYWRPHIEQSRRGILEAARLASRRDTALVLGAGGCWEVPLAELARTFDRVVLADLDEASMSQAVERLPETLRGTVEIRVSDVTSFAEPLMEATARIVDGAETVSEAHAELESLYGSIETLRRFPDLPQADLVVSSLVLSELARYPSTYTAQLLHEKFGSELGQWRGYGDLWSDLRAFASSDHATILSRLAARGGVVYFADTVGRGPGLAWRDPERERTALQGMASRFVRIGLFRELRSRPESRGFLRAALEEESAGGPGAAPLPSGALGESLDSLLDGSEAAGGALPDGADRIARAASRLLCRGRMPVRLEIAAIESMMDAYRAAEPRAFEQLLDWDAFLAVLYGRGIVPVGASRSWKWLEYACRIPSRPGGFWVRGTVFRFPSGN